MLPVVETETAGDDDVLAKADVERVGGGDLLSVTDEVTERVAVKCALDVAVETPANAGEPLETRVVDGKDE